MLLTNPAFKQLFGDNLPPLEDLGGRRLPTRAHPARMAARGETFTEPFSVSNADGSRRWFEASGQPIKVDGLSGGVVVIRDVTHRSLLQIQEQFMSLAGHELRTPLTALRGSLQLLQRQLGDTPDERVSRYVELALAQSVLLSDLVGDLADVIRLHTGQLPINRRRVDLGQLTREAVELVRPAAPEDSVRVDAPTAPVPVSGDDRRLQQVVLNLVSNAMQYAASQGGIDVRLWTENRTAVLEVVDYGPGIAVEDRRRVFERFFQVDADGRRGVGVGMYLVHAIVSAHGGTVEVEQTEPQGTTFVVRLPLLE
jgi:PAS domain S-box-containing protein